MDFPYWLWLMSLVMVFEVETPRHCSYEPRTSMRRSSRKSRGSFSWLEGLVERAEGLYKIQGASRRSKNIYTVKWVKENHLISHSSHKRMFWSYPWKPLRFWIRERDYTGHRKDTNIITVTTNMEDKYSETSSSRMEHGMSCLTKSHNRKENMSSDNDFINSGI